MIFLWSPQVLAYNLKDPYSNPSEITLNISYERHKNKSKRFTSGPTNLVLGKTYIVPPPINVI